MTYPHPNLPTSPVPRQPLGSLPWPPEPGAVVDFGASRNDRATWSVAGHRTVALGSGDLRLVTLAREGRETIATWDQCRGGGAP